MPSINNLKTTLRSCAKNTPKLAFKQSSVGVSVIFWIHVFGKWTTALILLNSFLNLGKLWHRHSSESFWVIWWTKTVNNQPAGSLEKAFEQHLQLAWQVRWKCKKICLWRSYFFFSCKFINTWLHCRYFH